MTLTFDISDKVYLLPDLRKVNPGEVVFFVPDSYDQSKLIDKLQNLRDEKYPFNVRLEVTCINELKFTPAVRMLSALYPDNEAYLLIHPRERKFGEAKRDISALLRRIKHTVVDVEKPPLISLLEGDGESEDISYSSFSFGISDEALSRFIKGYVPDPDKGVDKELEEERSNIEQEIANLILEYAAKFKSMPPLDLIQEAVGSKLALYSHSESSIIVTDDYRIILPEYKETEIKIPPLAKAVYILFLLHPEGIRLKDIADHKHTLRKIYDMVKPGADFDLADSRIDDLATPGSESLQQKLSMTRNAIKRTFMSPTIAEQYMIKGKAGDIYKIDIPASMIQLPESLR